MNIYGEKVVLRALSQQDQEMLFELISDPNTEKMIEGKSFPVSYDDQLRWFNGLQYRDDILRCIIAEKGNEDIAIGTIILSDIDYINGNAEVHIKMANGEMRGKGLGTDALKTIVNYAFRELRLNCVYSQVLDYNIPSQKLFEKCCFSRDGVLRQRVFKDGQYHDVISYSVLSEEMV